MEHLPVNLGRDEDGDEATADLATGGHWLIAGETRSGKSVACYSLLGQTVMNGGQCVRIVGVDPTNILLKPVAQRLAPRVDPWIVLGTETPGRVAEVMSDIRVEMVRRIEGLTDMGIDKIQNFTPALPLLVVVLEELPGIVRVLEGADRRSGAKPSDRLGPRFLNDFETLAAEGAKVGIRLLALAQRPDAAILGGYTREQLTSRWCFRTSGTEGLRMMMPDLTPEQIEEARRGLAPGAGFLRQPGERPRLTRADLIPDYKAYRDHVQRHDLDWLNSLTDEEGDEQ